MSAPNPASGQFTLPRAAQKLIEEADLKVMMAFRPRLTPRFGKLHSCCLQTCIWYGHAIDRMLAELPGLFFIRQSQTEQLVTFARVNHVFVI